MGARTPIFIPDFRLWQKPVLPFSWKKILRQEYYGFAVVGAFFFISDFALDILIEGEPLDGWARDDWFWIVEFTVSMLLFLVLRALKKRPAPADRPQGIA